MTDGVLWHNPRCSKSREALALLRARGIEPRIVAYLETPPDATALREVLRLLGVPARALLRPGEAEYAALALDDPGKGDDALVVAMAEHPRLIERPVYIRGKRAVIGRPPERVLDLL